MSNPWAEVYKDLRLEILNDGDLQERRKLRGDIKTTATQTRYDLKSRVAKMKAQGKTDLEIKQYLDKYISNSKLPGEQKAQIRQVALSSGYEPEGNQLDEFLGTGRVVAAKSQTGANGGDSRFTQVGTVQKVLGIKVPGSFQQGSSASDVQRHNQKSSSNTQILPDKVSIDQLLGKKSGGQYTTGITPDKKPVVPTAKPKIKPGIGIGNAARYGMQKHNDATRDAIKMYNSYEPEGQQIAEESEKVLVRITTEDGRTFEKKVPREKISDLRKRYKTVVEVGSSEKGPTQTSNKPGGVSESKHVKRWWDDDGDGKGYEDGEVGGKFKKKKKKVRSESLSDWRYEIQIDENQIGLTPKEMKSSENGGEKKNEGESEPELSEHNDTNTWKESDRQLVNRLAEELGAEVLGVEVLDEFAGALKGIAPYYDDIIKAFVDPKTGQIIKSFIPNIPRIKPPVIKPTPIKPTPAPGPKPTPAPGPKPTPEPGTKPEPAPGPKPEPGTKPQTPTTKPPGRPGTTTGTGTKTGTGTGTQTTPQTQTTTPIPTPTPPRGGGPVPPVRPPGGGPILTPPPFKIPVPSIGEPKNVGKVVKV